VTERPSKSTPAYLRPYLVSTLKHGPTIAGMLWGSRSRQLARFDAIARIAELQGRVVLDLGCGCAELFSFLLNRGVVPRRYVGVEAVPILADAARAETDDILQIDFVTDDSVFECEPDVSIFCGSLNTLDNESFWTCVQRAYHHSREGVVFNHLSSADLAAARHLIWQPPDVVRRRCQEITANIRILTDYLDGDTTVWLGRE
jgi:hypothetical protein